MDDDAKAEAQRPLDDLLDLGLYAPLGAVMSLADELPRAVDIARRRFGGRLRTAHAVGQFTVTMARRRLETMRAGANDPAHRPGQAEHPPPAAGRLARSTRPSEAATGAARETPSRQSTASSSPGRSATSSVGEPERTHAPSTSSLAIPGYDSLAASQVVQRLAGLEPDELEEVRRYEIAHRRRRTVLARVEQLRSDAP